MSKFEAIFKKEHMNKKDNLIMLLKRKEFEIMHQILEKDFTVWIEPAKECKGLEFFYVLSGALEIKDGEKTYDLACGDSFYVEDITENIYVHVVEKAELLYFTNIEIFDDTQEFVQKLDAIIDYVNEKDHFTKEHCARVHYLCTMLYPELTKLFKIDFESLVLAAIFHDVGKCYLPSELIEKKEVYTQKELIEIRKHIVNGYNIVKPLFGNTIASIVLHHHEKLDGSGYMGLKGEEITMEERILSVANKFDILISEKPNGSGFTINEACDYLCSRTDEYDSLVTKILRELIDTNKIDITLKP